METPGVDPLALADESVNERTVILSGPEKERLVAELSSAAKIDRDDAAQRLELALTRTTSFEAPFPSPQLVVQYNQISPELGTRLVSDHLEQRRHNREMDAGELALASRDSSRADKEVNLAQFGLWAAYLMLAVLLGCAMYAAFHGQARLAALLMSAPVLATIGVVLQAVVRRRDEGK